MKFSQFSMPRGELGWSTVGVWPFGPFGGSPFCGLFRFIFCFLCRWTFWSWYTAIYLYRIKTTTYHYLPGTQMTLVLIGKDLVLEGSTTKIEDKQVPGMYIIYIQHHTSLSSPLSAIHRQQPTTPRQRRSMSGETVRKKVSHQVVPGRWWCWNCWN